MLSVVFITCNRKKQIVEALKSCFLHTNRQLEVVVVDNASIDGTHATVEKLCEENRIPLKYRYMDTNTGVSYARNIGYELATGDVLFFMDDDAIIISECNSLDIVSDYIRAHDDIYAATGTCLDNRYGGEISFAVSRRDYGLKYPQIRSYVGFSHFIKKGFTLRNLIYPNNLHYGAEELYVGMTVLKLKGKIIKMPEHIVEHHPSINTRIDRREGTKNCHINTYVIKKYFLSSIYQLISFLIFLLRVLRFSKLNLGEVRECLGKAKERYDAQYNYKMTFIETICAIRKFGVLRIL